MLVNYSLIGKLRKEEQFLEPWITLAACKFFLSKRKNEFILLLCILIGLRLLIYIYKKIENIS